MHQIRVALRGKGVVLMGKNTMVRRALRSIISDYPQLERLLPHVRGNIGFVFTSSDLAEIRDIITANKVAAPARAGALAPRDVHVPGGNTGMEPGKTSFFQALGIPTKIARGTIEIVSDVKVVTAGTRVGPSEATLLNMLNISPFTYGMTVVQIFDQGNVFPPDVLDVSTDELVGRFLSGVKTIAALSLALNSGNCTRDRLLIRGCREGSLLHLGLLPAPLKLCPRSKNISRIPKHSPLLPRLLLRLQMRTLLLLLPKRRKKRRIRMMTWSVCPVFLPTRC